MLVPHSRDDPPYVVQNPLQMHLMKGLNDD
jgi:hypothetical protein